MIYIIDEDDSVLEVWQGPEIDLYRVRDQLETSYHEACKAYETAHPRPGLSPENAHLFNTGWAAVNALTNQPDHAAWLRSYPKRASMSRWFEENGYAKVDFQVVSN